MFWDDAKTAARVLGLALTSRSKGPEAIPMAGVPFHAVESYLAKMIRAGHRVAICEQTEDPALAKGLVKRDVVRLMTPGTLHLGSLVLANTNETRLLNADGYTRWYNPTEFTTPRARAPLSLASRMAASVSAVSPDWLMAMITVPSSISGLR